MPLNRTWFNALVDDDGSNTIGTVWNKTQIDALLDSVDALVGPKTAWTTSMQTSDGITISVGSQTCHYSVIGDVLFYRMFISQINVPAVTPFLRGILPAGLPPVSSGTDEGSCRMSGPGFTSQWGWTTPESTLLMLFLKAGDVAFQPGLHYIRASGFYFIR